MAACPLREQSRCGNLRRWAGARVLGFLGQEQGRLCFRFEMKDRFHRRVRGMGLLTRFTLGHPSDIRPFRTGALRGGGGRTANFLFTGYTI